MRILLCLLALVAAPAWAEWEKAGESNETSFYFDSVKVVKNGNIRKIWELQNQKNPDKTGVMSRRFRVEYNCKLRHSRILLATAHSEPMGNGKMLDPPGYGSEWRYIKPGTPSETILQRVCVK